MPVNPSYSGGRDLEDHSLKPAQANRTRDPISKKPNIKTGLAEWLKWLNTCLASSNPSTINKKKEK
jgi:hypothetical protein